MKLNSLALRFDSENNSLKILDQTQLPHNEIWLECLSPQDMSKHIKALRVRGAPLIGVAAALSIAQQAQQNTNSPESLLEDCRSLRESRPTAVNLMWTMDRMMQKIESARDTQSWSQDRTQVHGENGKSESTLGESLLALAVEIFFEDVNLCAEISKQGSQHLRGKNSALTYCNTGSLATAGAGTALGIIKNMAAESSRFQVYFCETRPLLQGGRLTAWELLKSEIPSTLICDNMAAHIMSLGKVDCVIVGADRITCNGDFANKIGTYSLAVSAAYHRIPFYVAAPISTVDLEMESGKDIPIEQRNSEEVCGVQLGSQHLRWSPKNVEVYNPAFDVTPASLVTGWILNSGVYDQSQWKHWVHTQKNK